MPSERHPPLRVSSLARRIAVASGLDLAALAGSGPGGRIMRADVERAAAAEPPPQPPRPAFVQGAPAEPPPAPAAAAPERYRLRIRGADGADISAEFPAATTVADARAWLQGKLDAARNVQ